MQTFLPYPDFVQSARVLDYQRLGKQRVETKQIYYALTVPSYGWKNHPAVRMWRGHEGALATYGIVICEEWRRRGYKDSLLPFFLSLTSNADLPAWVGDNAFHLSHQSNLIRKLPSHYSKYFDGVPNNLEYVWPI